MELEPKDEFGIDPLEGLEELDGWGLSKKFEGELREVTRGCKDGKDLIWEEPDSVCTELTAIAFLETHLTDLTGGCRETKESEEHGREDLASSGCTYEDLESGNAPDTGCEEPSLAKRGEGLRADEDREDPAGAIEEPHAL